LNAAGEEEQALVVFDGTRSSCDRDVLSAEEDVAYLNDGVGPACAAGVELVRVTGRDDLYHVRVVFQTCPVGPVALARELKQATPFVEEARAIAEVAAELEERVELG
jgi:hypothetical protein